MSRIDHPDLSNNQVIAEAIRTIALKGVINRKTGAVKGTGNATGYIVKIHDDKDDELFGTVDVKEYVHMVNEDGSDDEYGYHEGVLLGALQKSQNGMLLVPKMYSDVVITKDADTGTEYISMFSDVDVIQLDSHDKIIIGVKEREPFDENNPDSDDVCELKETGVRAVTSYSKDHIETEITDGKDTASIKAAVEEIEATVKNGAVKINDKESTLKSGDTEVKVTNGTVYIGSSNGMSAVLGEELVCILNELVTLISTGITPTLGSPLSTSAAIGAISGKLQALLSSTVKIQR